MPYPMFKSTANSRPVISRPLPLRSYQDQDLESSRWSMSQASDYPEEDHTRSFWPTRLPIPPRSPLRSRFNRPNAPPALTRNFHSSKEDADLGYYFDESLHIPTTATTTSSFSSSHCPTPSAASAPACHTTFASADPNFNQWLAATVRHQRDITARELASATRMTERELPPPPPPKDVDFYGPNQANGQHHARSDSAYDYTNYLQDTASPLPPPSSLSLCNSSGWSCVARRTARSP
jgi:hypothetical protein